MREVKAIKINSISLVPKAKNNLPIFFPGSNMMEFKNLVLNSGDGFLTVIILDLGIRSLKNCLASRDLLRNMAHEYLRSGAKIEKYHSRTAVNRQQAAVVESFIVQRGDPRFKNIKDHENTPVDVTGTWVIVIKLFDKELQLLYRGMNAWNGVSIFGEVVFDKKSQDAKASAIPIKFVMT